MVKPHMLTRSQTMTVNSFLENIKVKHSTDMKELCDLYNIRVEQIQNSFFQQNRDRLPFPTFEEQWNAWEIFPSDPKTHPQYYTYDFK